MGLFIYQENCSECCALTSCTRIYDQDCHALQCHCQIYKDYYPYPYPTSTYESYPMKYIPASTSSLYYQMQDSQIQGPNNSENAGLCILANVCEDVQKTEYEQNVPIDYSIKNKNQELEKCEPEPSTSTTTNTSTSTNTSVPRKTMACDHCGKTFTHKGDMNKHLRKHTGEQPFSCPICDRRFAHTSNLARHLKVHSGDKPFSCERCHKSFSRKDKLIMHQKTKLCLKSACSSNS